MERLKRRWKLIWSYIGWEDYLGIVILVLGIAGYLLEPIMNESRFTNFYLDIRPELIGIGVTVLIIDNANEAIKRREEKKRLILQLGSPDNSFAIEALRQIQEREWLEDGSLRGALLIGANLQKASLWRADFRGAHFEYADLSLAILNDANLSEAYLIGTNLEGTRLKRANLIGAFLNAARMTDNVYGEIFVASLENTDLRGANLMGSDVTAEQLATAILDEETRMPNGTLYDGRFDKEEG